MFIAIVVVTILCSGGKQYDYHDYRTGLEYKNISYEEFRAVKAYSDKLYIIYKPSVMGCT